jgi:hypothetical protein
MYFIFMINIYFSKLLQCLLTNLCIVPLFVRESRELYNEFRGRKHIQNYSRVNTDTDDE